MPSCAYLLQSGQPEETPTGAATTASPVATVATVVRLGGSNTMGNELAPKLALGFLSHAGSSDGKIDESGKAKNKIVVSGHVKGELVTFAIDYPGSSAAFQCLGAKACDIGMASRPINGEEIDKLKPLFEIPSAATEHVVAMDGIAVVVNRANHVVKLSVSQIADIFSGTTTNWSQVGGSSQPIQRYVRGTDSGTYDTFQHVVMHGKKISIEGAKVLESEPLSQAVSADEGGIGFIGLPYVDHCKALAVQDGDGAALTPSAFSVATEDYALSRRLFFYTPEKPEKALASQFVDFALSDDGQKIVEQTGFVSLAVAEANLQSPANAPPEYTTAIAGARRLSFDFRFHAGTSALDVKGKADVDRLVRYLKKATPKPTVSLFGFTDNTGVETKNVELSRQRAKAVADFLKRGGIETNAVDGFGSALSIAPNDTPEGRDKNRRIEVWVK